MSAAIRWDAGKLRVTSTATITNDTDQPVDALTFNLVPAKIGRMVLSSLGWRPVPGLTSATQPLSRSGAKQVRLGRTT